MKTRWVTIFVDFVIVGGLAVLLAVIRVPGVSSLFATPGARDYYVGLDRPVAAAVDRRGDVYVVDNFAQRVVKFDSQGTFLFGWGSVGAGWGSGEGQLAWPDNIALDNNDNIYVSDSYNKRIQKFDSTGRFLLAWAADHVSGIAVDTQRNVYTSSFNFITKYDEYGHEQLRWEGGLGVTDARSTGSGRLAADIHNNVYMIGSRDGSLSKFDNQGHMLMQWPEIVGRGVAVDVLGNMYVQTDRYETNSGSYSTIKYNAAGQKIGDFVPTQSEQLTGATNVTADMQGNIYVVGSGYDDPQYVRGVVKLTNTGSFVTKWGMREMTWEWMFLPFLVTGILFLFSPRTRERYFDR